MARRSTMTLWYAVLRKIPFDLHEEDKPYAKVLLLQEQGFILLKSPTFKSIHESINLYLDS
jgi:hypothetical protein